MNVDAEHRIETERLRLVAATVEQLNACIEGDRTRFYALLAAYAPDPFAPPPETGDVLAWFRDAIANDPGIRSWFFYWVIDRQQNRLVGSAGFGGRPDADGCVIVGYSTYPENEGKGYASEAANALVTWALAQPGVREARATIKPDNLGSQRVAARAGLRQIDTVEDEQEGTLQLWSTAKAR